MNFRRLEHYLLIEGKTVQVDLSMHKVPELNVFLEIKLKCLDMDDKMAVKP